MKVNSLLIGIALSTAYGQVSSSAYRVLGQTGLTQNGLNLVQGLELHAPGGIVLDSRGSQVHMYISDTGNARILAWPDVNSYQNGDAPAIVLGQPSPQSSSVMGIGVKGFSSPLGMAVDPLTGNLYVADYGNNRVVRFPSPFDNPSRVEPDAVYGEPNFTTVTASAASPTTLKQPSSLAFDSSGNLWVADSGNNRVLRFAAASLNAPPPVAADTVIGQKDFLSNSANAGSTVSATGFDAPVSVALDGQDNLYVADLHNGRILRFAAPLGPSSGSGSANGVWGQSSFTSRVFSPQATASSLSTPTGVAVDGSGNIYVVAPADNRVLIFSSSASASAAKSVLGQADFTTTTANTNAYPLASQNTLSAPYDVKVDRNGNVFVADGGNNRALEYPAGSKSAAKVWGQNDFISNGANQIKPASVNLPYQMAIDYSQAPFALYVSDTGNNRVLIWKDSVRFRSGDPADLVIGQPSLRSGAPNVDGGAAKTPSSTSLSGPTGIVVNPADGTLYVADSGNNRVLRFPRPVAQTGRITPDAVIGQLNFTSSTSASVSATSLNTPGGVAISPNGHLFVADTGNNRVLEFPAGAGNGAAALRVYGQSSMTGATRPGQPSPQTLASPQGIFVDQAANLYVADAGTNRVLIFSNTDSAPITGATASAVIGQADFSGSAASFAFKVPIGVGVDSSGNVYVSDNGNNRVLMFSWPGYLTPGAAPTGEVGQPGLSGTAANWDGQNGQASADSLYGPAGIYVDRQDTLYVGDAGNNRVMQFLKPAVVSNAATFQSSVPVSPGTIATINGWGLAGDTATAQGGSWPGTLLNRQVLVNDQLVGPLYYIDPHQVNFQLPSNTPVGSQRIAIRLADSGELVAGGSFVAGAVSPGIFTLTQNGSGQAAARNQDNSVNGPGNPAAIGSVIQLYGTGQGQVSPAVPDGGPAPSGQLSNTLAVPTSDSKTCFTSQPSMCVAIGSGFGTVQYSGLAPGFVGLWQINVVIPSGIATGNSVGVRVIIDGAASNLVTIAVK